MTRIVADYMLIFFACIIYFLNYKFDLAANSVPIYNINQIQLRPTQLNRNKRFSNRMKRMKDVHPKRKKRKTCNKRDSISKENVLLFKIPPSKTSSPLLSPKLVDAIHS